MNFSNRSYQKELLDRDDIPFSDIKRNMQELEFINKYLGGHAITLSGLKKIMHKYPQPGHTWTICEAGCGGGDNIKAIEKWCRSKNIKTKLIGIDINPECIEYAKENCRELDAIWITSDYRTVSFDTRPDIIFSSLFCHHFTDAGVVDIFRWMKSNITKGFFVNDLHRHVLAYYSIKWLTSMFSKSYLVKNDAPLSVSRGFRRKELEVFMQQSGVIKAHINWKWAFRWLVTAFND
jgi:ubiquinone/menaquinone biosynthesis C-methylase UbiE